MSSSRVCPVIAHICLLTSVMMPSGSVVIRASIFDSISPRLYACCSTSFCSKLLLIGDVAGSGENARDAPRRISEDGCVERNRRLGSRLRAHDELVVFDDAIFEGVLHARARAFRLGEIVGERRTHERLLAVAREPDHLLVDVGDVALRVDGDERVDGSLDEAAAVVLLLA